MIISLVVGILLAALLSVGLSFRIVYECSRIASDTRRLAVEYQGTHPEDRVAEFVRVELKELKGECSVPMLFASLICCGMSTVMLVLVILARKVNVSSKGGAPPGPHLKGVLPKSG